MSEPEVRVRFAPSPTGWLHVGGARTAYFNWLFARGRGGRFVIRIEDTDAQRSSPESESGVLDDLDWLGLDHDEGPDVGGPHGPYRQSERLDLYRAAAERLLEAHHAYPCFCTDQELEERRRQALAAGRTPHYDRRCRGLSAAERDSRRDEGRPESVRFAVEARDWVLDDLVRGEVRFPDGMVGDFVLLRSTGLPTYNFAAAVDDAAMRISHVIRAEEHLANTPRQLMIYEAMGTRPPRFAHVPLILNRDRSKMSKREGEAAVSVSDWRRAGYVPEALLSYLALLGFHPGDDREILTREELLRAFSLERVGKSGSVFDPDKLRWVNAHYLHHASGAELRAWERRFCPSPRAPCPRASWSAGSRRCAGTSRPSRTCRPSSAPCSRGPAPSSRRRARRWRAPRRPSSRKRSPPISRRLRSGAPKVLNPPFNGRASGWGSRDGTCSSRSGPRSRGGLTGRSCR